MRAALYTRVSKKKARSVAEQEQELRDVATEEGWRVDHVFVDDDRSASRYARRGRPGFEELRAALAADGVGVLAMWESSRGSRKNSEWAEMLELCRDRGVLVYVHAHRRTLDPRNLRDMKTLQQDGVDSEYEAEQTRDRIMRNVRANAVEGKPHGKNIYGFARRYEPGPKGPVFVEQYEVPEQAAVIREMARRVLAGKSCYSIANDLNDRGEPSPGNAKWTAEQVKRVLVNPTYAGKRVLNGVVMGDAVWSAIIDPADHERIRARLLDPRRRTVRDPTVKHLLSGTARCGVCGSRMRVQKNRTHRAYLCVGEGYRGGVDGQPPRRFCVSIKTGTLDDYVTAQVLGRLARPDAAVTFVRPVDGAAVAAAEAEVANLQRQLDETAAQVVANKMSPGMAAAIEAGILPLIEDAKRRATPTSTSPALVRLTRPGVDVFEVWEELSIGERREVIGLVVEIRVAKGRQGARTFDRNRLAGCRWAGDPLTWGEHWAASSDHAR